MLYFVPTEAVPIDIFLLHFLDLLLESKFFFFNFKEVILFLEL